MTKQQIILSGTFICLFGVVLDIMVTLYAYFLIHLGTLIVVYGIVSWLRIKENRQQVNKYYFSRMGFVERWKSIFDFSWERVSILWTFCAFMGILIIHIGSLAISNSGAYNAAVETIKTDAKVLDQTGGIFDFSYIVTGNTSPHGRSTFNFGVIGSDENVKVTVAVNVSNGQYETKKIEIN